MNVKSHHNISCESVYIVQNLLMRLAQERRRRDLCRLVRSKASDKSEFLLQQLMCEISLEEKHLHNIHMWLSSIYAMKL